MTYTALIVDDENLERDAIALMISRSGRPFTCLKAANGEEAVNMVHEHDPQVVFMDIQMPVLSGLEAARQIKAYDQRIAIVFLTAWGTFDFAKEALQLGATDYLVKPTTQQALNSTLDKVMAYIARQKQPEERMRSSLGHSPGLLCLVEIRHGGRRESAPVLPPAADHVGMRLCHRGEQPHHGAVAGNPTGGFPA
jgi:two-component system response regulator YesN